MTKKGVLSELQISVMFNVFIEWLELSCLSGNFKFGVMMSIILVRNLLSAMVANTFNVQFISLTILLHEFCGNSKIIVILPDRVELLEKNKSYFDSIQLIYHSWMTECYILRRRWELAMTHLTVLRSKHTLHIFFFLFHW